ncbi:MAG: 50S ribosomal protein L21 [Bacteroidota bacterium]
MYAIVSIKGKQYKVAAGQQLLVNRLKEEAGETVSFEDVLLVDNDSQVSVGTPTVSGVTVTAKVVDHVKDKKIIVFHKKRRKGYRKKNGHRQALTQIEIESIG